MKVPWEVKEIIEKLEEAGFKAYIVGGCVRDLLLGRTPQDWDITTNAKPEEIQKIFPNSFYENKFLTVTVRTESQEPTLKEIEITTFRKEAKYSDKRHPDEITYAQTLEEDLKRRDFTINAMAIEIIKKESVGSRYLKLKGQKKEKGEIKLIDLFDGKKDLEEKIIKAVGDPNERFSEDALRMIRAVRIACELGFEIEQKTAEAIIKNSELIKVISFERIRDELIKIIMSEKPVLGIELLGELGLLKYIIPELLESYGVSQNKHHIYDCYQHALKSLEFAAKKGFNLYVRLGALLHDIGKPRTKKGEGQDATFYSHEIVGAKMVYEILNRLKFPKRDIEKITKLVRYHLFYYNVGEVSESSVRRLLRNVGKENIEELLQIRMADRIGSGVPKAEPYKLRHLRYVIEKVSQDPISAKMLKINGNDVMQILNIKPGPKVGQILDILLSYVLEDPQKNRKDFLEKEIERLGSLSDFEIENLAKQARELREKIEQKRDEMTKKKYWIV